MNSIAQEARKRQSVVKLARRRGKSYAAWMYGVSLSSVERGVPPTAWASVATYGSRRDADIEGILEEV